MKAIILAAGEGNRLKPYTDNYPKCMISLENKAILDHQIDLLKSCGIEDIVVIKGYMADHIVREDIRHYVNNKYSTTNMVMTLWCAREEFNDDVIISYGDIVYNEDVIRKLLDSNRDISIVVDDSWAPYWALRFEEPLSDAEALSIDEEGCIKVIGQKANCLDDVQAAYIGLMKFTKKGLDLFTQSFLNAQECAESGGASWGILKPFKEAYMTDMLQGLINEGCELYAIHIDGQWLEIDDVKDYQLAQRFFKEGKVLDLHLAGKQDHV